MNTWGSDNKIKIANPNDVMELHREIGEGPFHNMDDQEKGNAKLKKMIVELEFAIIPRLLFVKPLSVVQPIEDSLGQCHKFQKVTFFLVGVHSFVA